MERAGIEKNCQRRKWYWNGTKSATQVEGGERRLVVLGGNICLVTPICLGTDGGGLTVYVLLSLVNKKTALAFLIGQPLGG